MEILPLAYSLSLLTYSLGALLYGSPLPVKSVKKWGVLMMYDGLASAVLVSSYSLLLRLGEHLLGALGASWPSFIDWLTSRTAVLVTAYLAAQSLATSLKLSGADVLLELLKHVASLIAASLTAIKMIYLISIVVYSLRDRILAVGVLLYAIPLRVGKGVGAAMIALSLIYYVGLPLMPAFAHAFESPQLPAVGERYGSISGKVVDVLERPVPHPIVSLYRDSGDPTATRVGDAEGRFHFGPPQDLMPLGEGFDAEVVFMGYRLRPDPARLSVPWTGVLRIGNLLYAGGGLAIIFVGVLELRDFNLSTGSVVLEINVLSSGATLFLLKLAPVQVNEIAVNGERVECSWSSFSWRGLAIEECRIALEAGESSVQISYSGDGYPRPDAEAKHYVNVGDVVDYLNILLTTAASYLYSYLLLPSAYLAILSASSYALSRFLGGGLRLRVV